MYDIARRRFLLFFSHDEGKFAYVFRQPLMTSKKGFSNATFVSNQMREKF